MNRPEEERLEDPSKWSQERRDNARNGNLRAAQQWERNGYNDPEFAQTQIEMHLGIVNKLDAAQRSAKPDQDTPTIDSL